MAEYEEHVPACLRGHFVAAYEGQYGFWFEFDGAVNFKDPNGGGILPFAYGKTIDDCRKMMKNFTITQKEIRDNDR